MQHLILITLVLVLTTFLLVRNTVGFDKAMTLSLHIAARKKVRIIYASLLTVAVAVVLTHGLLWLSPQLELGIFFDSGLLAAAISILLAAWIPDVTGWKRNVHYAASYGILGSFIVMSSVIVLADISIGVRLLATAVLISEIIMVGMFFWAPKARAHFLIYQALYIFGFLSLILALTYAGRIV